MAIGQLSLDDYTQSIESVIYAEGKPTEREKGAFWLDQNRDFERAAADAVRIGNEEYGIPQVATRGILETARSVSHYGTAYMHYLVDLLATQDVVSQDEFRFPNAVTGVMTERFHALGLGVTGGGKYDRREDATQHS